MARPRKKKAPVDRLSTIIMEYTEEYTEEIASEMKDTVDKVTKEVEEAIKGHITFEQPTGDYVNSFDTKTTYESKNTKRNTWYVKEPHYRLTHLLERGHAKRGGGRTKAYPHIKYGDDIAKKRMEELAKEAVKNG
jgi:hypothetical protein